MRNGRDAYLGQARRFLTLAEKEFTQARGPRDDAGIRQAAEKAWGAVVQATNAILVRYGAKPGVGTGRKQDTLGRLEMREPRLRAAHVSDRYSAALLVLHARCFYDGDYNLDIVEREIRRAGDYIQTASRL